MWIHDLAGVLGDGARLTGQAMLRIEPVAPGLKAFVYDGPVGKTWQIEARAVRGQEPDENHWSIERAKLESWSVRASFAPSPAWSMQVAVGGTGALFAKPAALSPAYGKNPIGATVFAKFSLMN